MEPLTVGQQLLNQRLLAAHCLPEQKLLGLWKQLRETEDMGADSMADTISECNVQLRSIGLEIRCIAMKNQNYKRSSQSMSQTDQDETAMTQDSTANTSTIKYYAMVNSYPDEIGKKSFMQGTFPGEFSYIKIILENLVEEPQPLAFLLNLRSQANDPNKVTLQAAEQIIHKLIDAKWLDWSSNRKGNSALIQLAPRTYMELSHMLTEEFGMDKEALPQMIVL
ncbi:hypothetical protein MPSEU_000247300 [Mayamaea pseudoterrestris]|nr:hypothetical protein MPSEU_000247300 [Mayamaea pseudoterrestris]